MTHFQNYANEKKVFWIGDHTEDRRSHFRHYKYV